MLDYKKIRLLGLFLLVGSPIVSVVLFDLYTPILRSLLVTDNIVGFAYLGITMSVSFLGYALFNYKS